ncbi:hypothetical protein ND16A_1336 [Thalassotalea sp. ND16A]|nr:hypothetical protein ND16A_1336 [Thalassotalea sp. ND16A]
MRYKVQGTRYKVQGTRYRVQADRVKFEDRVIFLENATSYELRASSNGQDILWQEIAYLLRLSGGEDNRYFDR